MVNDIEIGLVLEQRSIQDHHHHYHYHPHTHNHNHQTQFLQIARAWQRYKVKKEPEQFLKRTSFHHTFLDPSEYLKVDQLIKKVVFDGFIY